MPISVIFIFVFLFANLFFVLIKKQQKSPEAFILAERSLSGFNLFFTLLASNLSAFTIFGVSGAGYRIGWAFFPVMAFGTGFMAFSFILFGIPLRRLSLRANWITPAQCIQERFQSTILARLYAALVLIFTLPYLAVQIGAAGNLLASVSTIPAWLCSLVLTSIIVLYIVRGGMHSVVHTDIFQAFALYLFAGLALLVVLLFLSKTSANTIDILHTSEIAARNGIKNSMPLITLISYYVLWLLADPMFPHMTQRFFAAKSDKAIVISMAMYPFASLIIFFMMTGLGVAGNLLIPGLTGTTTDSIFTKISIIAAGNWAPIFSIAALAALMSTLDSQLLSCSSIFVEDFIPAKKNAVLSVKLIIVVLALLSWLLSLKPPATLLSFLTGTAFAGYAILAPIMFAAIYIPQIGKLPATISLLAGTALVFVQALKLWTPPVPAVFFNAFIQTLILLTGFIFTTRASSTKQSQVHYTKTNITPYKNEYLTPVLLYSVLILFILGTDFWNYGKKPILFLGIPTWVWYHCCITCVMGIVFFILYKKHR